jgi:hypothetical protein
MAHFAISSLVGAILFKSLIPDSTYSNFPLKDQCVSSGCISFRKDNIYICICKFIWWSSEKKAVFSTVPNLAFKEACQHTALIALPSLEIMFL